MLLNNKIATPYYLIDEALIIKNLEILRTVKELTGCKILLAQKAFSMYSVYPLIAEYLDGATASGLHEARLGFEKMKKENHVFSPAYREDEFKEICGYCDHVIFNSFSQLERFGRIAQAHNIEVGLRVNPEHSTQEDALYDPCAPSSRMGITADSFREELTGGVTGLHFHTLCEQNSDALEETLAEFERKFSRFFGGLKWVNFGGGHHITRADYDLERLVKIINSFKQKYNLQVYLEPGEAVVLNCGFLVSSVLDIVENGMKIAVLDTSAACHMPDVLEMPYRPRVTSSGAKDEKSFTYRLAACTCLAGDVIGDYSFDEPLNCGDKVIFEDMALYTTVKNNTFNGINLPSIVLRTASGKDKLIRSFGYEDFKSRL